MYTGVSCVYWSVHDDVVLHDTGFAFVNCIVYICSIVYMCVVLGVFVMLTTPSLTPHIPPYTRTPPTRTPHTV